MTWLPANSNSERKLGLLRLVLQRRTEGEVTSWRGFSGLRESAHTVAVGSLVRVSHSSSSAVLARDALSLGLHYDQFKWVLGVGQGIWEYFLALCECRFKYLCWMWLQNPSSFTLKRLNGSQRPGSTFTVRWLGTAKAPTIEVRAHMFSGKPVTRLTWRIHLDLQICPKVRYQIPLHVQHSAWCSRSQ